MLIQIARVVENDLPVVRHGTVLDKIDPLPSTQCHTTSFYGIVRDVEVRADFICAGISSGPSVLCR